MTARMSVTALVLVLACSPGAAFAQATNVVAEVRVHGNYRTPDADVLAMAGIRIGQPLEAGGLEPIAARLRASGRFPSVEVRKRYRTLDETGEIAIIIMVQEIPGSVIDVPAGPPNPLRRLGSSMMFLPVVDYVDGYGLTYGARASFVHVLGKEGRLSVPLTWGGRKVAALEADRTFATGPVGRIAAAASVSSRENPAFRIDDVRRELTGEVIVPLRRRFVNLAVNGGWVDVDFGDVHQRFTTVGTGLTLDTRDNPAFPRNAVFASAGWRSFSPEAGQRTNRYRVEAQGYLGLIGSTVLAVRAVSDTADRPLPIYEKALAGGAETLRGFRAGSFVGDNLAAGTLELRWPLNSPMGLGQSGFRVFGDAATAYDHGVRLGDATWHYGVGAGWYLRAPMVSLNIDVGHGIDHGTRVHVTAGLRF